MKELAYIFKAIWKFLTTEPKDRADEEWEDIFIAGEAIRQTKELSDKRRCRRIYRTGRNRSKRKYR